jgi:hypothetical protein
MSRPGYLVLALSPLVALVAVLLGLVLARTRPAPIEHSLESRLPTTDLAWFTASRAHRSPTTEEPSAPLNDGPLAVDVDPGSGVLLTPKEVR